MPVLQFEKCITIKKQMYLGATGAHVLTSKRKIHPYEHTQAADI